MIRRAWFWLLYRFGIRKPPPFTEMVLATLRANPEGIGAHVIENNALLQRLRAEVRGRS